MGYISTTVLTTFTLLIAYSFLVSVVQAELPTGEVGSQQIASETLHKRRPVATWIKTLPIRRLKQFSAYKPTDIEFIDDLGNIDKRFDDYGHMRFGKRGGGEDGFDDYGHMRFGR